MGDSERACGVCAIIPLTKQFALEYAGWFDFLLPGLDRLGMPIPLGGTSNHFDIETLRALHGWDAFNVTEDADLGIRLARSGFRVLPIDSTTFEEAIPSLGAWVKQRSRWLKGYMRTVLVHTRNPCAFIRAVGLGPFLGFAAFVCGSVAAALFSPLLWAASVASIWLPVFGYDSPAARVAFFGLLCGNVLLTITTMLAPLKRRWLHLVPYGATVFAYWLLISVAAYKGFAQLLTRPFYWEKTTHGVRKTRDATGERPSPQLVWTRPLAAGVAVLCLFAFGVAANPWLKERNAGEAIVNLMLAENPAGFAPAGRSANAASDIHFEYGALDNATLVFDSDATYDKPTVTSAPGTTRFDTSWLGGRVALARWEDSVVSVEGEGGLAGLYDNSWPSQRLSLNGAAQARLLLGQGFTIWNRHGFASLESGWRWRGGAAADEATLDTTLGVAPWRGGLLMLQTFSAMSTGEARVPYRRYNTHKLQLSMAQNLGDRVSVQVGLIETVAGTDAGKGGSMLALWWRF